jgi:hypothetical protein
VNDPLLHAALFLVVGLGIVALAAFYAEPEDAPALRSVPRRWAMFVVGCGILALLLVLAEHTVASVR